MDKEITIVVPNGWLPCPKIGDLIQDTFIPFKTILDKTFNSVVPLNRRFNITSLNKIISEHSIRCIIDLTSSSEFYNPRELKKISHVKLFEDGEKGIPSEQHTSKFIEYVDKSLTLFPDQKIGVHCIHGFNKTGFMIIAFLVKIQNIELSKAIQLFAEARPPGIYRQDYIDELRDRYDPNLSIVAPQFPDWYTESNVKKKSKPKVKSKPIPLEEVSAAANLETLQTENRCKTKGKKLTVPKKRKMTNKIDDSQYNIPSSITTKPFLEHENIPFLNTDLVDGKDISMYDHSLTSISSHISPEKNKRENHLSITELLQIKISENQPVDPIYKNNDELERQSVLPEDDWIDVEPSIGKPQSITLIEEQIGERTLMDVDVPFIHEIMEDSGSDLGDVEPSIDSRKSSTLIEEHVNTSVGIEPWMNVDAPGIHDMREDSETVHSKEDVEPINTPQICPIRKESMTVAVPYIPEIMDASESSLSEWEWIEVEPIIDKLPSSPTSEANAVENEDVPRIQENTEDSESDLSDDDSTDEKPSIDTLQSCPMVEKKIDARFEQKSLLSKANETSMPRIAEGRENAPTNLDEHLDSNDSDDDSFMLVDHIREAALAKSDEPVIIPKGVQNVCDRKEQIANKKQVDTMFPNRANSQFPREVIKTIPTFMVTTPLIIPVADAEQLASLRDRVKGLLRVSIYGFVGTRYRPLTLKTYGDFIEKIESFYYTYTTNGQRYMLFIGRDDEIYFIDENNWFYKISNLVMPHFGDTKKQLNDTILDGEFVVQRLQNRKVYTYLISNIYAIDGKFVDEIVIKKRLSIIENVVLNPRLDLSEDELKRQPFEIKMKRFFGKKSVSDLWNEIVNEPYSVTGMALYPLVSPDYKHMKARPIYHWQPPEKKTVTFKMKSVMDLSTQKLVGELYVRGNSSPYATISNMKLKDLELFDGKNVKCHLDVSSMVWSVVEVHKGLKFPISYCDVGDSVEDLIHPVTLQELTQ